MLTKVCRVCGRRLPLSELVKDKRAGLGRASICKPCYRDLRKTYPSYTRTKKKRKRKKTMSETYEPGELFVYMNGDHWELGEVKCANNTGTGYFCWYSMGDTAANTPTSHMHKLANAGWSHIEKLREIIKRLNDEARTCENTQEDFDFMCSVCGKCVDNGRVLGFEYCPRCGRRIVG